MSTGPRTLLSCRILHTQKRKNLLKVAMVNVTIGARIKAKWHTQPKTVCGCLAFIRLQADFANSVLRTPGQQAGQKRSTKPLHAFAWNDVKLGDVQPPVISIEINIGNPDVFVARLQKKKTASTLFDTLLQLTGVLRKKDRRVGFNGFRPVFARHYRAKIDLPA